MGPNWRTQHDRKKGISPPSQSPKSRKLVPFKTPVCQREPVPGPQKSKRVCNPEMFVELACDVLMITDLSSLSLLP